MARGSFPAKEGARDGGVIGVWQVRPPEAVIRREAGERRQHGDNLQVRDIAIEELMSTSVLEAHKNQEACSWHGPLVAGAGHRSCLEACIPPKLSLTAAFRCKPASDSHPIFGLHVYRSLYDEAKHAVASIDRMTAHSLDIETRRPAAG
jgi:hypothetical protein